MWACKREEGSEQEVMSEKGGSESVLRIEHRCRLVSLFVTMKMKQVTLAFRRCSVRRDEWWQWWKDRVGDAELKERNHLSKRSN